MSTTVTSLPRRRNACAISQPMGPLPTISSCGTFSRRSKIVSLVRKGVVSRPGIGGTAGREPVAMTNWLAVNRRPSTSKASAPVNRPSPKITSTPRPRKRSGLSLGSMPAITPATRSITRARSTVGVTAGIAQRSAWRISCAIRADLISVFDGTQPYHRQSPPRRCFSTSATLAPSAAPPAATTSPPAPPPMITRSNSGLAKRALQHESAVFRAGHRRCRAWHGRRFALRWSTGKARPRTRGQIRLSHACHRRSRQLTEG